MDLPCGPWQDHVAQKWIGLDTELKEKFTSLQEIDDVFKCALSLTTEDDLDFLESTSATYSVQKEENKAAQCRERGNSSFKSRKYTVAALHYSQGVCAAPQSSAQLSLCYANRSAALYHLQLYQECLDDIDAALQSGYPSHLSHKLQDRRTTCLQDLNRREKAEEGDRDAAQRSHEGPDRVKAPSAQLHMFGICPQAAVSSNVEKGRHLVAVDRIAAGEVILGERPYSCVLIPGLQEVKGGLKGDAEGDVLGTESRRCHWCLSETLRPVPCESCSYSRYCSSGCRRDAWQEHHRWECPLGAELTAVGVMLQLALRVTLKAGLKNIQVAREPIRDDFTQPKPDSLETESHLCRSYNSVFHLLHHLHRHSPTLRFLYAVTVATVYLRLSQAGPPPPNWRLSRPAAASCQSPGGSGREGGGAGWSSEEQWLMGVAVLRHVLQLRCNAQAIVARHDSGAENSSVQSSREIRIATAIFPTLSLLNHSCRPNTSLAFSAGSEGCGDAGVSVAEGERAARGVTVTVRAAKVITAGQEVLHCYGPHSSRMATAQRQRVLHEQYFFLCQCEACSMEQEQEEDEEGKDTNPRPGAGGGPLDSAVLCCKCKGSLKKSVGDRGAEFLCSSCGRRVSSSDVTHRLQQLSVGLQEAVELLERERPGEALKLLQRTRCQSGGILAETHPLQGELADATARAYATMGDWKNAAAELERSVVAIGSQYGEDSVELGQQLFKLAQLHFNGGARGPTLSVIHKVRRLLRLHLGPRCPELEELTAMEDCLRG